MLLSMWPKKKGMERGYKQKTWKNGFDWFNNYGKYTRSADFMGDGKINVCISCDYSENWAES